VLAAPGEPGFLGAPEEARLAELGLTGEPHCVCRIKANCLRICEQGPIAVAYPEGVWFEQTARILPRDRGLSGHIGAQRDISRYIVTLQDLPRQRHILASSGDSITGGNR
jgi:(2Fe-2S) ferredoxin